MSSILSSFHLKPEAACKCISVVALTAALGQLLEFLHVAAAENDVVGLEGGGEALNDVKDIFLPLVLSEFLQPAKPDVVLVRRLAIGKMTELHGLQMSVDDHSGAR